MLLNKWAFIDGLYTARGVDLYALFDSLDGERSFNIIDSILVEDMIADAQIEGALVKARAAFNKVYDRINTNLQGSNDVAGDEYYEDQTSSDRPEGYIPGNYIQPDDNGFPGLERPKGMN